MKRFLIAVVMLLAAAQMAGCSRTLDNAGPNNVTAPSDAEHPTIDIHFDWPKYRTVAELIDAAANIYSGTVTDVSFEVIDMQTGKIDESPDSESTSRMLYTVYTVLVKDSYKGDNPGEIRICIEGGLAGCNEKEQYGLLEASGLADEYPGIPVTIYKCELTVGEEYLFCTSRTAGGLDMIVNPTQFAYSPDSKNAKEIIRIINEN